MTVASLSIIEAYVYCLSVQKTAHKRYHSAVQHHTLGKGNSDRAPFMSELLSVWILHNDRLEVSEGQDMTVPTRVQQPSVREVPLHRHFRETRPSSSEILRRSQVPPARRTFWQTESVSFLGNRDCTVEGSITEPAVRPTRYPSVITISSLPGAC